MNSSFRNQSFLSFVAIQAALKAGQLLLRGFGSTLKIRSKPGRQNFVTEYDQASEESIISTISEHFPDHSFLAEERGMVIGKSEDILWIIDPLDGTTNFAHQLPFFTISIAAYRKNEGLCGVIYQPYTKELFVAEKGRGAYLNGERLRVSHTEKIEDSIVGTGFPFDVVENPYPYMDYFMKLTREGVTFRHLGSAALSLAYVAAGKLDGFLMDHLYPWDLAAGKVIIREAGGTITRYDGSKHDIYVPSDSLTTNTLLQNKILALMNHS